MTHTMLFYSVWFLLLNFASLFAHSSLTETVKANSQLHPESAVFDGQHVTFPIHFKVSKEVKNGLTFGSFDTCFGSVAKDVNGTGVEINSMPAAESSSASDEMAREPSPRLVNLALCILLMLPQVGFIVLGYC